MRKAQTRYMVALWPLNSFLLDLPVLYPSTSLQHCHRYLQGILRLMAAFSHAIITITKAFYLYIWCLNRT